MNTGIWIRELLKVNGITVDKTCEALNLSRPGFYKIITTGEIREKHVEKLADLLHLSKSQIRYGFERQPDININLFSRIISTVEEWITLKHYELTADQKALLISRIYQHFIDTSPAGVNRDAINDLLNISESLLKTP